MVRRLLYCESGNLGSRALEEMTDRGQSFTCETRAGETTPVERVLKRAPAPAPEPAPRGALSLELKITLMEREPQENVNFESTPF